MNRRLMIKRIGPLFLLPCLVAEPSNAIGWRCTQDPRGHARDDAFASQALAAPAGADRRGPAAEKRAWIFPGARPAAPAADPVAPFAYRMVTEYGISYMILDHANAMAAPLSAEADRRIDQLLLLAEGPNRRRPPATDAKEGIFVPSPLRHIARGMVRLRVFWKQNERALDAGCGDGRVVAMMAELFGAQAQGIDSSGRLIGMALDLRSAIEKIGGAADRMAFLEADFLTGGWSDYDVIYYFTGGAEGAKEAALVKKVLDEMKLGGRLVILGVPGEVDFVASQTALPDLRPLFASGQFRFTFDSASGMMMIQRTKTGREEKIGWQAIQDLFSWTAAVGRRLIDRFLRKTMTGVHPDRMLFETSG